MKSIFSNVRSVLVAMTVCAFGVVNAQSPLANTGDRTKQALVLFYMASCPHCRRFDPVLKQYAQERHIPVLAYTLDGESLPSFPDSFVPSPDEMHQFFPNGSPVVPALFLIDSGAHQLIPVLTGEANSRQLNERLEQIQGFRGYGI